MLCSALLAASIALLSQPSQEELQLPLRVLYASDPGTEYSAGWAAFLAEHTAEVRAVAHAELTPELVRAFDLLVIDGELMQGRAYRPGEVEVPLRLADLQGHPVVLMGGVGGKLSWKWGLAGSWGLWGCHCLHPLLDMSGVDGARAGERHVLLREPFALDEPPQVIATPRNYREHDAGAPASLAVLRVFASYPGEPGYVTSGDFRALPDAEWIASGINSKTPGHAALLRHGSIVLWGFHGPAAELTGAGAKLFLNTLAYAHGHAGALVENLRLASGRAELLARYERLAPALEPAERRTELAFLLTPGFPDAVLEDPEVAQAWFDSVRGTVRQPAGGFGFELDARCAELGQANDSPAFLAELARRLAQAPDDELARALYARYVPAGPGEGAAEWLRDHAGALYFTDVGGYVWKLRGERADVLRPLRSSGLAADCPVRVSGSANEEELVLELELRAGWHVYAQREGTLAPLALALLPGSSYQLGALVLPADVGPRLTRRCALRVPLQRHGWGTQLAVELSFQACDVDSCRPPETVRLER